MNVTGFYDLSPLGITRDIDRVGGFETTADGARRIVECAPAPLDGGLTEPDGRAGPLRWRIAFEDGEVIHISMPEHKWTAKLRMLGEDDAESRLNDYETFGTLLIEETAERGNGQFEHSTLPPQPALARVKRYNGFWGWLTATFKPAQGGIGFRIEKAVTRQHVESSSAPAVESSAASTARRCSCCTTSAPRAGSRGRRR